MFQKLQSARDYSAGIAFHGEVERRIFVFDCVDVVAYLYLCSQFFLDLSLKGFLWAFARLNLAAGELPAILELPIAPLGGKELPGALWSVAEYESCNNVNGFLGRSIAGKGGYGKWRLLPKSGLKICQNLE